MEPSRTAEVEGTMTIRQGRTTTASRQRQLLLPLCLLLLLLTTQGALALSITNIQAPATIPEGELLTISFTTDEPASLRILRNGVPVSTSGLYQEQLDYESAATLSFILEATGSETVQAVRSVEVLDMPLTITLEEPASNDYTTTRIPVDLATNRDADLCYVVTDSGNQMLEQRNATSYNGSLTLDEGLHTLQFKCSSGGETAVVERTVKIDTRPPTLLIEPSGEVSDEVILTVTTDEVSDCRYGTSAKAYAQLPHPFPQEKAITHTQKLSIDEGSHVYYVACSDVYGNEAPTESTSFTYRRRPTAVIEVEGENPRPAGTYELTLTVSEELAEMPRLSLAYQGGKTQELALSQEDETTYKGLLIVDEDAGEKVASFSFSGEDQDGQTGSKITEGELFVVDTVAPGKVETFKAVNETEAIELSWYYAGEEGVTFNLYRGTSSGVAYTDYYRTVSGERFSDQETYGAVRYYYRIAAVDEAGNVGPLSHEEWASAVEAQYNAEGLDQRLDPLLQVALNERLRQVEVWILDAERALADLQAETGNAESEAIRRLGLIGEAQRSLEQFRSAQKEYKALLGLDLGREEFDRRITLIQERANGALATLPLDIEILDSAEYEESVDDASVEKALARLGEDGADAYKEKIFDLQGASRVRTALLQAVISYADASERERTLITRHITLEEPGGELFALELLGEDFEGGNLTFGGGAPIRLDARTLRYALRQQAEQEVLLIAPGLVAPAEARGNTFLLLPKPPAAAVVANPELDGNEMTGGAVGLLGPIGAKEWMVILVGVIIVAGLLAYYLRLQGEEEPSQLVGQPLSPVPSIMHAQGMPLPLSFQVAPPQQTRTLLIERQLEPLAGLLFKGHLLIDENRYPDALYFYRQALARFDQEPFSSKQLREAVRQELSLLHAKLALSRAISLGHDAAYAGDVAMVEEQMAAMRHFAQLVGEEDENTLVEKAKAEYDYLYRSRSRLKRDDEPLGEGEESL